MLDNCPVPPIFGFWYKLHDDSVYGWDVSLQARIEEWKLQCAK